MRNAQDIPLLHLYPQETWHGNAAIVGNRKGLEELRASISRVLEPVEGVDPPETVNPNHLGMTRDEIIVVPADGETHRLDVHLLPSDHENWDHLTLPYVEYQDKKRGYGDPELQILPPEWGMGLSRRLDIVSLPGVPPDQLPDGMWETFMNYFELSDEEKREFKREVEEWKEMHTRGGSS